MATPVTTTLTSAVSVTDSTIVVSSATSFVAGAYVKIDQELMQIAKSYVSGTTVPVLRGQDGTVTAAHKSSANVTVNLGSDFTNEGGNAAQTFTQYPGVRARFLTSYSASGAIAIQPPGSDQVVVLNGTSALAMTLANPTKDMDGDMLIIVGNGKSASTVTYTAGLGNAGSAYDVATFQNAGQVSLPLIACNGIWVALNTPITGTTTALSFAIA